MATYNQNIVDSYEQVNEATTEQNTTGAGAGDAFKEGFDLVTDEIAKNKKENQADEDREYMLKKRERDEGLAEMDFEKKTTMYQAEKLEYFNLLDEGIKAGLIDPADYSGAQNNREAWWKDQANQIKLHAEIGDKAEFKTRLNNAVRGEQAWAPLVQNSKILSISDNSPEAQRIDLAIDRWADKSPDSPPPIISKGGIDFFEIPSPDGGDPVLIEVSKVAKGQNDVYGDYEEPITIDGIRGTIGDDPKLAPLLKKGQATTQEIKGYIRKKITKKNGEIDPTKLKEVANSFALDGVDLEDYDIVDTSGPNGEPDGEITKEDITAANIEEIFMGMIESDSEFGKQNKAAPKTLAQRTAEVKLKTAQYKYVKALNDLKGDPKLTEEQKEAKEKEILEGAFHDTFVSQDYTKLAGVGGIKEIYKKEETKTKNGKTKGTGVFTWWVQGDKGNPVNLPGGWNTPSSKQILSNVLHGTYEKRNTPGSDANPGITSDQAAIDAVRAQIAAKLAEKKKPS